MYSGSYLPTLERYSTGYAFRWLSNVEELSSTEKFMFFYQTTRCHIPEDTITVIAVRTVRAVFVSQSAKSIHNSARQQVIKHHAIHQPPSLDFVYFSSRRISDSTNLFGKRNQFASIFCRETWFLDDIRSIVVCVQFVWNRMSFTWRSGLLGCDCILVEGGSCLLERLFTSSG